MAYPTVARPNAAARGELLFPYIPLSQQQRAGLLVDFLFLQGEADTGDFLDLLMFGESRFGFLLADAPVQANSLLENPAALRAALRDQRTAASPAGTLRALDTFLGELHTHAGVSAFYALVNQQDRSLSFSSAGHSPLLVYRPQSQHVYGLNCEGSPLGLAPQPLRDSNGHLTNRLPNVKSEKVRLRQHDLMLLYSTGLLQAKNSLGDSFGQHRLLRVIRKHGHMQPMPFLAELRNALDEFTMGEPLTHSITCLVAKNMQPNRGGAVKDAPEIEDVFLTIEEEEELWVASRKHPGARIAELLRYLGDRYTRMSQDRLRYYLARGGPEHRNGELEASKARKAFDPAEKYLQRELLKSFPLRQLLFSKYEFRGNTAAIATALEYYQNGSFQESLVEFTKVRSAIAESEAVHCFFGNLYLLLNMTIKARQEYLKALKCNQRCVHAHLALAYIALLQEDYEGTINSLTIALRLDRNIPAYERFLNQLLRKLEKQNGVDEWIA